MADRTISSASIRPAGALDATRPRRRSGLRRFAAALLLSREIWIIYLSAFLCGRAVLGPGVYPFGLALFWTVLRSGHRTHAIGAFTGVLLGMATVARMDRWLAVLVVLLGGLFLETEKTPAANRARHVRLWRQALTVAGVHAVCRIVFATVFEVPAGAVVWLLLEAVLVCSSIVIWEPLSALWGSELRTRLNREGWVAVALFAVMLSLGLDGLQFGPLIPVELWNRAITLGGAYIGGATTGAAVGTALAWVMGMHGAGPVGGTTVYALSGLLAGLFASRGKLRVGLGFLLGHLLLSMQTPNAAEIVYSLMHALLALAVLIVIPNGWLRSLERALPGSRAQERFVQVREERLREAVSERLRKVGGLLAEMGRAFAAAGALRSGEAEERNDIASVVEKAMVRLCERCPGYKRCWDEYMYQTYKEVVDYLRMGEARGELRETDMPVPLRQRCLRTHALTQTLHQLLIERAERMRWQKFLEGQLNVVPAQLHGVAALVEGLAGQVRIETGRSDELQVLLMDAFTEERVPAHKVEVRPLGIEGRYEIYVERNEACDGIGMWRDQVRRVVHRLFSSDYVLWEEVCEEGGPCSLRFTRRPPCRLQQASLVIPKEAEVSGDTFCTFDLVDGRVALILSDGMGSGPQAALQSQAAAQLLGTLLETGFDLQAAVRSVNSLLLVRSTEESFATLDALVIDQFTGLAQFIKVGSAPSFLVQDGEVSVIRSTALPVGILNQIDAGIEERRLRPGDTMVLVTDGLLDSVALDEDQEEWLIELLKEHVDASPETLVDTILERLRADTDGGWDDDVTVAVVRYTRRHGADQQPDEYLPAYRRREGA